jgi:hypothetical protein
MVRLQKLMTADEYTQLTEDAIARGFYRNDTHILLPGMAYEMPWYFDPTGERERQGKYVMIKLADRGKLGFLSEHYWRDWSHIRPPINLILPNSCEFCPDRKSSNGTGWTITGEWPDISITPSINDPGYHGWLGSNGTSPGCFSNDLEGRGEFGIVRVSPLRELK